MAFQEGDFCEKIDQKSGDSLRNLLADITVAAYYSAQSDGKLDDSGSIPHFYCQIYALGFAFCTDSHCVDRRTMEAQVFCQIHCVYQCCSAGDQLPLFFRMLSVDW